MAVAARERWTPNGWRQKRQTTVVGVVERKGRVRAMVAADVKADTLIGIVREHVTPKSVVVHG